MSEGAEPHSEQRGPSEFRDPLIRQEMKKAAVWLGMTVFLLAAFFLSQPLLLILAGIVFASILDGGTRLLGRVLPIGRGWRLAIVTLAGVAFIAWTFYFAGVTLVAQAEGLRQMLTDQVNRILGWATRMGLVDGGAQLGQIGGQLSSQLMGTLGRLTSAVGSALGALTSIVMIVDGYLIVPYVARRTVDLAPALVLGAQLLFGALFGLMGLMLADPIIAMIKVALEEKSKQDGGGKAADSA